jgi:hypothetical protein
LPDISFPHRCRIEYLVNRAVTIPVDLIDWTLRLAFTLLR